MREYVYFTGHSMYFYGFSVEFISVFCFVFLCGFFIFFYFIEHIRSRGSQNILYTDITHLPVLVYACDH